jgi:hypothetical protein
MSMAWIRRPLNQKKNERSALWFFAHMWCIQLTCYALYSNPIDLANAR